MKLIAKFLLKYFAADIAKYQHDEFMAKARPYTMEECYTDKKGHKYYRFTGTDNMNIPLERVGKMQDFMELMSSGLDSGELANLMAVVHNELALALAGKQAKVTKIGSILDEIENRQNMILHTELLYNFLAVQYIRDDEPVNEFVEHIHLEKVATFKEETKGTNTFFFFQVPELRQVNEFLKFTPEDWDRYWRESLKEQQRLKKKVEFLNSLPVSEKGNRMTKRT